MTHNVAVMVVQAGQRESDDASPDQARRSLLAVEAGGRAAMAELRHVMGLLTMSGMAQDRSTLFRSRVSTNSGAVRSRSRHWRPGRADGDRALRPASWGVDLAAYRVVQEALTNTVKYAPGAHVRIDVDYGPESLRVEVADTGYLRRLGRHWQWPRPDRPT